MNYVEVSDLHNLKINHLQSSIILLKKVNTLIFKMVTYPRVPGSQSGHSQCGSYCRWVCASCTQHLSFFEQQCQLGPPMHSCAPIWEHKGWNHFKFLHNLKVMLLRTFEKQRWRAGHVIQNDWNILRNHNYSVFFVYESRHAALWVTGKQHLSWTVRMKSWIRLKRTRKTSWKTLLLK